MNYDEVTVEAEPRTIDPRLVKILTKAGREWGPAGVARVAGELADAEARGVAGYVIAYDLTPGDGSASVTGIDWPMQVSSREDAARELARQQGHENVEARHAAPRETAADRRAYFIAELCRVATT